ncbi:MAG: hypothetical protein PHN75_17050 [Syntrophales bacterium]|nr:hypothetical protein [Syntrophales bacterium]
MKSKFWRLRVTDEELAQRKRVAESLGETESQIDRDLWQAESERIKDGRVDNPVPDILSGECNPILLHNGRLRVYTIPMWDDRGNSQVFVEQPSGSWLDTYNEKLVTFDHVRDMVEHHERAILSYL